MARKDIIEVEGQILGPLPNGLFEVALSNGHRVVAHSAEKMQNPQIPLLPGEKVLLTMTPYDLSKGRITLRQQ